MRIHVTQNDWRKLKKAQKPSFKTEMNCFSHGWKSMKVIPWRHWIGHKQTLRLSKIGISALFLSGSMMIPSTGEAQCSDYNERVYNFTRQQKGCNTTGIEEFSKSIYRLFMCVPEFFFGVVSIYFWLLAALGLLSDPWKPRLAGHPLQKDRENQVPRGSAASPEGWWNTRKPWVWSPLMEIFCVKNTAFHFVVWFPSWHLWLKCSVDASHDFRDQTKELLE